MDNGIPQHFIDDLVARIDIVELIDARVPLKKAGKNYVACCPFHEERTPSFTVSPDKQFYHCFGCGAHGTAIGFLMNHERLEFVESIEELAQSVGLAVPQPSRNPKIVAINESLSDLMEQANQFYQQQLRSHPQAQLAVNYLKNRGLNGSIAKDYGIGFAPPGWHNLLEYLGASHAKSLITAGLAVSNDKGNTYDRFRHRIMFPIRNRRGKVIGFGGRILEDAQTNPEHKEPKYLNSPETPLFHKGKELYGLYECRQTNPTLSRLVVVEGYMDVVSLAQFGIHYAVATLGTSATAEHVEKLFRTSNDIIFCFDGDTAGKQAAWRALENTLPAIRGQRQARFLFLPEDEDPDSLIRQQGQAAFETLLDDATPLSEYFLQILKKDIDLSHVDGRAQLLEKAQPFLSKIHSDIYRNLLAEQLARLTQSETRQLHPSPRQPAPRSPKKNLLELAVKRSNIRWVIALLLQYPQLAARITPTTLENTDLPGIHLLKNLLAYLQGHTHAKCGTILEHFRETEYAPHLTKLALWETASEHPEQEFDDAIKKLLRQSDEQRLTALLNKSQNTPLSTDEKQALTTLMRQLRT